jgi:HD superfamily phosphohydrolase
MSRRRGSVIRDPVHGDIHLSAEELALLDTRAMQRLRGVRQLGTAYLVFPGAQHTRFEHSLGTLHMTGRLIEAINHNRAVAPRERIGVAEDEARILRAAALVHDVTHIPFGHNIEDQSGILERHDSPARFRRAMAPGTELGDQLERMGVRREVLAVLLPPDEPDLPDVPPYWREILSDTICADILDYLRRDAYFTGLNLQYDDRVVQYFMVDRESGHLFVDVAKRGLLREDILSELVRVLDARYFFSERVYYHHAKITAGAIIAQAVENALREGGLDPTALYDQTDDSLRMLLEAHMPTREDTAARQRELLARLGSRRLLKRACVFPRYANRAVQDELVSRFFAPGRHEERAALESAVRERVSAATGRPAPLVVLYCPARKMQLKEAQTHVRLPDEAHVVPLARARHHIPRLVDLERSYRDLWKLYVLAGSEEVEDLRAVASAVAELLPEATNVYRAGV